MDIHLSKLKISLHEAIREWLDSECGFENWDYLDTYIGDQAVELMTDSAFNVLLAQKDLTDYLRANECQP